MLLGLHLHHVVVMAAAIFVSSSASKYDDCKPQYVHLSYGSSTSEMVVMWSTRTQCTTDVHYSDSPMDLHQHTSGRSLHFGEPRNEMGYQYFHRVKLQELLPGKTYWYRPISNSSRVGPYFFKTPLQPVEPKPIQDNTQEPTGTSIDDNWVSPMDTNKKEEKQEEKSGNEIELLVLSDLKTSSEATINQLNDEIENSKGKYAAIIHTGNIAMHFSSDGGKNADNYFELLEPAISQVPYMTAPGESEVEDDLFTHYKHRLSMPEAGWPMELNGLWYSVDIGPVHLISYSTHSIGGKYDETQHDWLIKDMKLANLNRERVPWIVAFGQQPMYCTYEDPDLECNKKTSEVKKSLEDIFYNFGADIVIQSYGKGYERSFPMFKSFALNENYTNPLGPVLIANGGASSWDPEFNFTNPAPEWVAKRLTNNTSPSFGRLHIIDSTVAEFEQVCFETGTILDSFRITQEHHGQFSTETLSPNISANINQEIIDLGGKPGVLNIQEIGNKDIKSKFEDLLEGDNKTRVIIGASFGSFIAVVLIVIVYIRRTNGRRKPTTRRWEHMDINYGKRFYDKAPDRDDFEENDFEIDMSEGTEPTRKLLSDD